MEQSHKKQIVSQYPIIPRSVVEVLDIDDVYDYMNQELITILSQHVDSLLHK